MTKQIDIQELIPYLKRGYVSMDKDGTWLYCKNKPKKEDQWWIPQNCWFICLDTMFDIKEVQDWEKSLIKVGE